MQLPAEKQSATERLSVILLVASGRGEETWGWGGEGSNCQSLKRHQDKPWWSMVFEGRIT